MIIAIDGPAASGKSVTAKKVAEKLDFLHLNTGSMYRAVTLHFINCKVDLNIEKSISSALIDMNIAFENNDTNKIYLNEKNISNLIRIESVNNYVSEISAIKIVRDRMVKQQRQIANKNNVVMEGRDIGTYVFPNADFKFYLTADINVRAKRRFDESVVPNININYILKELIKRDKYDESRKHSPLVVSDDAIIIDTTNLKINEQVNKIINIINKER